MSNGNEELIKLYKIDRICKPQPEIEQMVLKKVDNTESVYTRSMVQLNDASLPDTILYDSVDQRPMKFVSWNLFLMLKYRQDWRQSGYGLGELLYTISLLPNEELTLELKTWETSKTQQDEIDTTDVRNVSDIKSSSSNTNELTASEEVKNHEYADAKASYSGFGFSASVAGGWSQDVNEMQKNFAKQTQDRTKQASNEYRATHQVKMAVSRESGSEAKTTRKIKNINQTHTLNVNYYEVLREFEVNLSLYDISLVLLGLEPDLNEKVGTSLEDITLGQMIQFSRVAKWVQYYTDRYGVSPIKIIREKWSSPLYDAALTIDNKTDDPQLEEDKKSFQNTMLQYVHPTPGWIEPDEKGALRWGYEILPGQEEALLNYLYHFLPYSVNQMMAQAILLNIDLESAQRAILAKHAGKPIRGIGWSPLQFDIQPRGFMTETPLNLPESNNILVPGIFYGKTKNEFTIMAPEWVKNIIKQFNQLQETIGAIKIVEKDNWKVTLPTQGIYADLALGICSGAEDYYEIQRQYDLELKKLEIEKLRLEVEKRNLENLFYQQGKSSSSVVIKNPTDQTAINVGVNIANTPTELEIKKEIA